MPHEEAQLSISQRFARFAHEVRYDTIPGEILTRAKLLMLDAIGIAFASSKYEFARMAFDGIAQFGAGDGVVIGFERKLPLRDAVLINGMLVHGLDYDDTYLPGSVHMTASSVPCALGMSAHRSLGGRDFLAACIMGLETSARLGQAGKGLFAKAGFHPTALCGAMSCALVSSRLMGLDEAAMRRAQGIALSMASGSMQPMLDGTWTKRIHPGWAAAAGISAAGIASGGYTGPEDAYESKFGFYNLFLGASAAQADPTLAIDALGERWEFARASIKLYPVCHQSHAFMNAAIRIAAEHDLHADDVESVQTLVAEITRDLVCEPAAAKAAPTTSYMAQFSLPYAMAACLTRRRFGLEEIEEPSYTDPSLVRLARKVRYEMDPNPGFPKTRTGEVRVTLRNGQVLKAREEILPDEPASAEEIVAKFMSNATSRMSTARAAQIRDRILAIEREPDMRSFCSLLAG